MAGVVEARCSEFDTVGRPASVSWTGSDGVLVTSDVVARRAGGGVLDQVIDGVDHHPGDDFVYDAAGRLVDAWVPGRHVSYQFAVHDGCGPLATAGAGGALLTVRPGGANVWSYPSVAGILVATADQAGVKQGDTTIYDPHGNVVAASRPTP